MNKLTCFSLRWPLSPIISLCRLAGTPQFFLGCVFSLAGTVVASTHSQPTDTPLGPGDGETGATQVVYQLNTYVSHRRQIYEVEVLRAALESTKDTHGSFSLHINDTEVSVHRTMRMMLEGDRVNVWATAAGHSELTERLIPISVPILKGLLGYHVFIVKDADLSTVIGVDDLRQFKIGQVRGWSDIAVYRGNGLKVEEGHDISSLFAMLSLERYDLLPLGITEVAYELDLNKQVHKKLKVDDELLIYYPWPFFFYVSPKAPQLAERLQLGMERLVESGRLDILLKSHFKDSIKHLNLPDRRLLRLKNPNLPGDIPLDNPALWISPDGLLELPSNNPP